MPNQFPKLHNAMWPGLVGKGSPGRRAVHRPRHHARPDRQGQRQRREVRRRRPLPLRPARQHRFLRRRHQETRRQGPAKGFVVGSVVAPVWPPTGGGSAMGDEADRKQVRRAGPARPAASPRSSASSASARTASSASTPPAGADDWYKDPEGNQKKIAETFREAGDVAEDHGERLAAEGEICWGGMHSWRRMVAAPRDGRHARHRRLPGRHGPHAALHAWATTPPKTRILPAGLRLEGPEPSSTKRCKKLTAALRPWTIDFHVAQNDAHRPRLRHARQDRPPLPGQRPQRQARHPQARRLLAARRERQPHQSSSATSAGTAACSPTT